MMKPFHFKKYIASYGLKAVYSMAVPLFTAYIIGKCVNYATHDEVLSSGSLILLVSFLLAVYFVDLLIGILTDSTLENGRQHYVSTLFRGIITSHTDNSLTSGDLINRLNDDASSLFSFYVNVQIDLGAEVAGVLLCCAYAAILCLPAAICMIVMFTVRLVVVPVIQRKYEASYEEYMEADDKMTEFYRKVLSNICAVKTKGLRSALATTHQLMQQKIYKLSIDIEKIFQKKEAVDSILCYAGKFAVYIVIGATVIKTNISSADAAQLVYLYSNLESRISSLTNAYTQWKQMKVSDKRLTTEEMAASNENRDRIIGTNGMLVKNAEYQYAESENGFVFELSVSDGEHIALTGDNGAGKTTLVKLLTGQILPLSGVCSVDGKLTYDMKSDEIGALFTYIPQHGGIIPLTLKETLHLWGVDENAACENLLQQLGLQDYKARIVSELSNGEQKKLLLAIALLRGRRYLIADEPDNYLDKDASDLICQKLAIYKQSWIIVTHDPEWIKLSTQNIHLFSGKETQNNE